MKRLILIGCSIAFWTLPVLADENLPRASRRERPIRGEACEQIRTACKEAGFARGRETPKGKRLFKDCVQPIMDGLTVSGVVLDPTLAEQCRAHGRTGN